VTYPVLKDLQGFAIAGPLGFLSIGFMSFIMVYTGFSTECQQSVGKILGVFSTPPDEDRLSGFHQKNPQQNAGGCRNELLLSEATDDCTRH
jgi:hypothetical protein